VWHHDEGVDDLAACTPTITRQQHISRHTTPMNTTTAKLKHSGSTARNMPSSMRPIPARKPSQVLKQQMLLAAWHPCRIKNLTHRLHT
jgi:uncharacterized protein YcsI (UPF0317 family)